jgi:hypothetical protein
MPSIPLRQPTPWTASPKRSDLRFIHKTDTRTQRLKREGLKKGTLEEGNAKAQRRKGARKTKTKNKREREREKKEIKKQTKTGHKKTKCLSIVFPFHPFPFSLTPSLFSLSNPFPYPFLLFPLRLCAFAPLRLFLPAFRSFIWLKLR